MNTTDTPTIELALNAHASGLWWTTGCMDADGEPVAWYYGPGESHHPADRIGGPFQVSHVYAEYGTERWFLYADTSTGHFPVYIIVGTDYGESDALETLCELYPGVRVPADMVEEWEGEHGENCQYNGDGVLIDLDYMTGGKEVFLARIDL